MDKRMLLLVPKSGGGFKEDKMQYEDLKRSPTFGELSTKHRLGKDHWKHLIIEVLFYLTFICFYITKELTTI